MREIIQSYYQVGRRKAFRRFWLGMMISRTGDAFTTVAVSWVVLDIAGPLQLGVVLMCFGLPRIVSGPLSGRLVDRIEPRTLLIIDNATRGLLISCVPILLWQHRLAVTELYAIAVISALLSAVTEVSEGAVVPRLVADDELEAANSLLSANWEVAYIVGPAIAGAMIAAIGSGYALVCDAISFAVMSAICASLPSLRANPAGDGTPTGAARNWLGLSILLRFPAVIVLSMSTLVVLFLGGMAEVLFPVYSRTFLHASSTGYGVLVSATGIGALVGVVVGIRLSERLPPPLRIGAVLLGGVPLFGLLSIAPDLPVAFVLLGLASFAWGPYYALERSLVQRHVPASERGRVSGARLAISSLGFPLGSALGGVLLRIMSVPAMVLAMSGAYFALGLLALLAPSMRGLQASGVVRRQDTGSQDSQSRAPAAIADN